MPKAIVLFKNIPIDAEFPDEEAAQRFAENLIETGRVRRKEHLRIEEV